MYSYKLSSSSSKRDRKARRDEGECWKDEARKYRDLLGLAGEDATGSLAPHWDPYAAVESGFGHGNVTELWDDIYKWQQVALGVTIGIPVDEWDEDVHVSSDQFIMFGNDDYDALMAKRWHTASISARDDLLKRWNYANCRSVLACGYQIAEGATLNVGKG